MALSKVHWVRPELVAEITYLRWTDEPMLRHTVFVGLREDKPTREVRREAASRP
jgi:bifunctional non-homologous end joining protein LigD